MYTMKYVLSMDAGPQLLLNAQLENSDGCGFEILGLFLLPGKKYFLLFEVPI